MTPEERRQLWRERVAQFRTSGLSGRAWCIENDIKEHQLWYWVKRIEAPSPSTAATQWLPVAVENEGSTTSSALMLRIGSAVIEVQTGFDRTLLASVVEVLTQQC